MNYLQCWPKRVAVTVLLVALVVVVGSSMALAQQVGGFHVQPSVDLLKRYSIVTGDPDGSLRLETTITRAELAKIAVTALNQTAAATVAADRPPFFSDVSGHWAQGYIEAAKGLGIVGGYEDGSFRPNNPVTNAEALTILMRAVGRHPAGPWPEAYFDQASNLGLLTDGLQRDLPPSGLATRAAVFVLADRFFTLVTNDAGHNLLQQSFAAQPLALLVAVPGLENGVLKMPEASVVVVAPGAVMVQVNGKPAWPTLGIFVQRIELLPGHNEIFIVAVDEFGQRTERRLPIERQ